MRGGRIDMPDDIAIQEYWLWVEVAQPNICQTCNQYRQKTRKIDGRWICKDCRDEFGTE